MILKRERGIWTGDCDGEKVEAQTPYPLDHVDFYNICWKYENMYFENENLEKFQWKIKTKELMILYLECIVL